MQQQESGDVSGLCEGCMKREARSPHDLYCSECEAVIILARELRKKHAQLEKHDAGQEVQKP